MHSVSCSNTQYDVTDFANHKMVFQNGILKTEHKFSAK